MDNNDFRGFTVDEVAEHAGCGRNLVYKEIQAGRLIVTKIGKRTIILRRDRDLWLEGRRVVKVA
ncbi:MAG: helix-turn-helix domain-containing protein [Anaerolineales bacterium]|nr:helix-turn-helix domain-containing protein [Alphaproteobacteria bacterium]MCW5886774.1 helix-turn-helix domain-containing protein [Anaerolineales bacterium]